MATHRARCTYAGSEHREVIDNHDDGVAARVGVTGRVRGPPVGPLSERSANSVQALSGGAGKRHTIDDTLRQVLTARMPAGAEDDGDDDNVNHTVPCNDTIQEAPPGGECTRRTRTSPRRHGPHRSFTEFVRLLGLVADSAHDGDVHEDEKVRVDDSTLVAAANSFVRKYRVVVRTARCLHRGDRLQPWTPCPSLFALLRLLLCS